MKINLTKILLSTLVLYFIFFTFFGLNWGAPFYFHPDERNIASAVTQINFPLNMNPHFFAYGALPIYVVYFLGVVINFLNTHSINLTVNFEQAIVLSRIISGLLTLGTAVLMYKICYIVFGKKTALLSLLFTTTSTAFFQFSHFGTFEMWLSFFSLLMVYFFILFEKSKKMSYFILGSCTLGVLVGLKLSSLVLISVPLFLIVTETFLPKISLKKTVNAAKMLLIFLFLSIIVCIISSPFNIFDSQAFSDSMRYESSVALGTLPVFYTGEFYGTTPIFFQGKKILPFLINPLMTILSIPAIIFSIVQIFKKKNVQLAIITITFLALFISNSIIFAKWTRYIVPSLPYLYILIAFLLTNLLKKTNKNASNIIIAVIVGISFLFSFSFLMTTRINQDTRILASNYATRKIPKDSKIISEVYDLGIVPFNSQHTAITLYNFYDLDNGVSSKTLYESLKNTDYIILPSQRIYETRLKNPKKFPEGNKFYTQLFSGNLGFKKIYETTCDVFCRITYLGNPVFNLEQTANVFDHPTVYIFKRE